MMTATFRRIAVLLPAWVALMAASVSAQEAPAPRPAGAEEVKDGKGKWVPLFQRHAGEYRITDRSGGEARRLPDPLLRWWQPIRGGDDGALYLWVEDGRPVAAVTFFTFRWPNGGDRVIVHERHSFAPGPLGATWRGRSAWQPSAPGLIFKPVPDAPAPAPTASGRLRQMQALVREVSATTTDDKGSTWTMRALNKPLYRYEASTPGVLDGALFALAQGTDPEVFFFLEARGEGKDARWEYAVARFTDLQLRVDYQGREVFSGPHTLGGRDQVYYVSTVLTKASESPEDFD